MLLSCPPFSGQKALCAAPLPFSAAALEQEIEDNYQGYKG
jgi:hypothetical protein